MIVMHLNYVIFSIFVFFPLYSLAAEHIEILTAESAKVSLPAGKSITVESVCPDEKILIGGGGKCIGFLATENKAVLVGSSPRDDNSAWYVACTNMHTNPGDIQAKAWAICVKPTSN